MIEMIGLENENKWIDIVKQFRDCDVYYLPQYTKAFRVHGDGEPYLFYYQSEDTKAINVVMKRDISQCEYFIESCRNNTFFDIATPYGYGGFLIEGDMSKKAMENFNKEYIAYCKNHSIVSEFVRFHPLLKNHLGLEDIYELTERGKTVSMDLSSPEVIYSNIKAKTRNRMRKAESNSVKFFTGNTWDLFLAFKEIYDRTMQGNSAQQYYYFNQNFYKSVMSDLKDNAMVFYAARNCEKIAMVIVIFCNEMMHMHLTGSNKEYLHLSPVAFLYYKIAIWGYENGYKTLHLGGGLGSREDSLYTFKKNFNKNSSNRFVTGQKIFDKEKYDYLLELREKGTSNEWDKGFFPQYRA